MRRAVQVQIRCLKLSKIIRMLLDLAVTTPRIKKTVSSMTTLVELDEERLVVEKYLI